MNIGNALSKHPGTIPLFAWIWLLGSIAAASYFAFWLFPAIVHPVAQIYFQAKIGDVTNFWPSSKSFRARYLGNLSDKVNLYYTECVVIALSDVQNCDPNRNWVTVDPKSVDCTEISACDQDTYFIPRDVQALLVLQTFLSKDDHPLRVKDPNAVSFSDPAGWGDAGKWPVFFVTLFLAVKLGRAVGEFAFTEYTKG
jgi:hypothetical protein